MRRLELIWFDLTVSVKESEVSPYFSQYCSLTFCSDAEQLERMLKKRPFDAVCFDFDFPDRSGLRLLRETKIDYPSLPVLMLTVQHSEALAIWAFRTKIWDYLVKPIPQFEAERCLVALLRIQTCRATQPNRAVTMQGEKIPEEVSFVPKAHQSSLSPAIYYVEKYFRSKIRSEDVATLCRMSPFRFSRAFKETFEMTFRDYLVAYRLKEACRLLENPTTTVTDVAYAVGFNDASYFARIFKQRIGVAPSIMVGRSVTDRVTGNSDPLPDLPNIS